MDQLFVSCLLPWVPGTVQVIGGVVTFYGLFTTWRRYTPNGAREGVLSRLWSRIRPAPSAPAGDSQRTVTDDVGLTDSFYSDRWDSSTVIGRLDHLEQLVASLSQDLRDSRNALRGEIAHLSSDVHHRVTELDNRVDSLRIDSDEAVRQAALDGLWVAAFGVGLGVLGTFLGMLPWVCS